jgi:hypothetical protein
MGLNIGLYLRRSERTDTAVRSIGTEVQRIGTDFRPRRNKSGGLSHSPRQGGAVYLLVARSQLFINMRLSMLSIGGQGILLNAIYLC